MLRTLALAVSILTAHIDANRTAWNLNETALSPSTVQSLTLVGSAMVDGAVFAQPIIAPVTIAGQAHNALFSCTMNDSCYAFDAEQPGVQFWHTILGIPRFVNYPNDGFLYNSPVGCVATPVVDISLNRLFAICASNIPSWVLYALDLSTGAIINSVTVTATANGTGDPSGGDTASGGLVTFNPAFALSRSGVTLANGNVYVFFSSYADTHPWHGWAMGYSEMTLSQVGSWCSTPNGGGGGIWSAGGAAAVDAAGNLYIPTGNGDWNGTTNFGSSIVKLSPTLSLVDWFTPSNWATINADDDDLASNRAILIPSTMLLVHTGKRYQVFVLQQGNLGHLQAGGGQPPVQAFVLPGTPNGESGAYGSAWMNSTYYIADTTGLLSALAFNGSTLTLPAQATRAFPVGGPGTAAVSGSSNGISDGIIWTVTTTGTSSAFHSIQPGTLHALDAATLVELWNSGTALWHMTKFAIPVVANGKVYVATMDNRIQVFGQLLANINRISIAPTGAPPVSTIRQ